MKTLEEMRAELENKSVPKITTAEIQEYNAKPEVKERGAKIVTISGDRFKNILIVLLIVITISIATFAYLAYNDKLKLMNLNIPACPAPAEIPACPAAPSCPAAPACTNTCPSQNFTCSPIIKICGNSTCV